MKSLFLLPFFLFPLFIYSQFTLIPPANQDILYTGRIDDRGPDSLLFSYPGVSIRAHFTGTAIGAKINDIDGENYFVAIVNGVLQPKFMTKKGEHDYELIAGLDNDVHEIELVRITEPVFGETIFAGFLVELGEGLVPIERRERLIEYVGNSITCGYGNEGTSSDEFVSHTENHYMTYAGVVSRSFNADHIAVCKSGVGVYRNYGSPKTGVENNMKNHYSRNTYYGASYYDFKRKPDVVCVNLGTNDFSGSGGDVVLYRQAFSDFIDTLHTRYVSPDIICLLGPIISGSKLTTIKTCLTELADSVNREKKENEGTVHVFEMSKQTHTYGIGVGGHPAVKQNLKNGYELAQFISELKGWGIIPRAELAEVKSSTSIEVFLNVNADSIKDDFSSLFLTVDGEVVGVEKIVIDNIKPQVVYITPSKPVNGGEEVLLHSNKGVLNESELLTFSDMIVKNDLAVSKLEIADVSTINDTININFSSAILPVSNIECLSVVAGGAVLSVASFENGSKDIALRMESELPVFDTVYLNFTGACVKSANGVAVASEMNRVAKVPSYFGVVDIWYKDEKVIVEFREEIETMHSVEGFAVDGGEASIEIINYTVDSNKVYLTLSNDVKDLQSVTVSYTGNYIESVNGRAAMKIDSFVVDLPPRKVAARALRSPGLRLFPNPAKSCRINYEMREGVQGSSVKISVFSINGTKILQYKTSEPSGQIVLPDSCAGEGLVWLRFETNYAKFFGKVMLE